jgi:hypothetical protein
VTRDFFGEINTVVVRDGAHQGYYEALDRQHFGDSASASNFLEFTCIEEALFVCAVQRGGLHGDDRELLVAMGVEDGALLAPDKCRYLVFTASGQEGVVGAEQLSHDVLVTLLQEKPGVPLSLVVAATQRVEVTIRRPRTDIATVIIGSGGELWTLHPGLPVAPSTDFTFEKAGYSEGDQFSIQGLLDATSPEGIGIRSFFSLSGADVPPKLRIKIPVKHGGAEVHPGERVGVKGA